MKQTISVRELIEFVYRSGDIDQTFKSNARQLEGQEVHKAIQATFDQTMVPEYSLSYLVKVDDIELTINGRADGIRLTDKPCIVEIKTTRKRLEDIEAPLTPLHLYQAMMYAYMAAQQWAYPAVEILIIYGQPQGKEQKVLSHHFTTSELSIFFEETIAHYSRWMKLRATMTKQTRETSEGLGFPFPYRKGQRELAKILYRGILNDKHLMVEAPTGIGKTLSALFPAVKSMQGCEIDKIFYLTPKTTGRDNAKKAFIQLQEAGFGGTLIEIQAKEKLCLNDLFSCNPMDCIYAKGHYDRINQAIYTVLNRSTFFDVGQVLEDAEVFRVCPFEFALDLSLFMSIIVCDYNYAWDPDVQLKRFFLDKKPHVLLVDEAHNLVERSRTMYSAELTSQQIKQALTASKGLSKKLHRSISSLHKKINQKVKQQAEETNYEPEFPLWLYESCLAVKGAFEGEDPEVLNSLGQAVLDMYFSVLSYLKRLEYFGDEFVHIYYREPKHQYRVVLFCRAAGRMLEQSFSKVKTVCLFSATLSPLSYFKHCFGLKDEGVLSLKLGSPYPPEHLKIMTERVSTRYKDRASTLAQICDCIYGHITHKKGNAIVFFPSYEYLNLVYQELSTRGLGQVARQSRTMSEKDREDFIASFEDSPNADLTGFCVLGGVFSEGIDLKSDRLSLVIVVGVGLPMMGLELQLIEQYYDELGLRAYDYTYTIPGMIRVLQAGGRLIRDQEDRGRLVLIDDRYSQPLYESLLPHHWKVSLKMTRENLGPKPLSE